VDGCDVGRVVWCGWSMVDTWEGELKERWEDGSDEVNVLSRKLAW
jgi:hypothetical protein